MNTDEEMRELDKEHVFYKSSYLSENTCRTYWTGIKAFVLVMLYFGFQPMLPVSDEHLSKFIVFLARSVTMSTIKTYLYGVRAWHLVMGFEFPPLTSRFEVFRTLQGVKRFVRTHSKPKLAMTADILIGIFQHLSDPWNNPVSCAIWCCFLVAYYGMFRKDNVSVRKAGSFNPNAHLCREDLVVSDGAGGLRVLWVRVRGSKTNQFKERVHYVALVEVPGSYMCPVTWWERHCVLNPAGPQEPAFSFIGGRGTPEAMTHAFLVKMLKELLTLAGYDATSFSGHSFRRGGATDAFNLRSSPDQIQLQGDWMSTAYLRYNELDEPYRLQLPTQMAQSVQALAPVWEWESDSKSQC